MAYIHTDRTWGDVARLYVTRLRKTKQYRKGYYYGVVFDKDVEPIGHIPGTNIEWITRYLAPYEGSRHWLDEEGQHVYIVKGAEA